MQVLGETMIFKNDFGFSTTISNKKQDGTYENMSVVVGFRKGDIEAQNIPHKTKINIKNGFLTFYVATNNEKKLKIVVLDYEIVGGTKPQSTEESYQDPFDTMDDTMDGSTLFDNDDWPF